MEKDAIGQKLAAECRRRLEEAEGDYRRYGHMVRAVAGKVIEPLFRAADDLIKHVEGGGDGKIA